MNSINNIQKAIVKMAHYSQSSHIGACLSIVTILYCLYFEILNLDPGNPEKPDRDRFILSKGHASAALYATLAERGFFPKAYLDRFYIDNGLLPGHLDREAVPGIEVSSGSLGHGLSLGVGMSIANRQMGRPGKVYVLLGDGECNEGSVWEAAMLAASQKLVNLTVIVDFNGLQGLGRTATIIDQRNPDGRWRAFGWETATVDGHNLSALTATLKQGQQAPKAIIAHTIKGKGVSFMENSLEWHYKAPNDSQYQTALRELGEKDADRLY
jgi:transketolase